MTPESKKLLSQYASAIHNECIYGESETANMNRWRELGAKTEAARKALEGHIEKLEALAAPATCQPSGAIGQGTTAEPVATVEAGKWANRLQWVSDEAMARTPVGTRLCVAPAEPSRAAIDTEARDASQKGGA